MKRDQCLRLIARHCPEDVVVPVYQAAFEWIAIRPDGPNFISVGAMGQAASHALGFALAMPERRVIVLDGDGSLLMNLGALVTIAEAAPPNLLHFVCENGCYEANGGHPIPGRGRLSFAGLARAAGYRDALEFAELGALEAALPGILRMRAPLLIDLKVERGEHYAEDFGYMHSRKARDDFKAALRRTQRT